MRRPIHLPKNQNFSKMVGLKVDSNLKLTVNITIWNILNRHLLFRKTTKILHKCFKGHLKPFVFACNSEPWVTHADLVTPSFFLILQLYSFIYLLPDGEQFFSFFAC